MKEALINAEFNLPSLFLLDTLQKPFYTLFNETFR
jgi:hypothetical protein